MPLLSVKRLRDLFTDLGYDVSGFTDTEVTEFIEPALVDRKIFGTDDVHDAFEVLSKLRKPSE